MLYRAFRLPKWFKQIASIYATSQCKFCMIHPACKNMIFKCSPQSVSCRLLPTRAALFWTLSLYFGASKIWRAVLAGETHVLRWTGPIATSPSNFASDCLLKNSSGHDGYTITRRHFAFRYFHVSIRRSLWSLLKSSDRIKNDLRFRPPFLSVTFGPFTLAVRFVAAKIFKLHFGDRSLQMAICSIFIRLLIRLFIHHSMVNGAKTDFGLKPV